MWQRMVNSQSPPLRRGAPDIDRVRHRAHKLAGRGRCQITALLRSLSVAPGLLCLFTDITRPLQAYLGHKNIQHTVRYTELSPTRFKNFGRISAPRQLQRVSGNMERLPLRDLLAKLLPSAMNAAARVKAGARTITAPVGVHQKFGLRPRLGRP
jgi:hypothetical protein